MGFKPEPVTSLLELVDPVVALTKLERAGIE